ncbi:MAG: hypothetical protein Q9165_000381 [Trypethelium subeluteriae]
MVESALYMDKLEDENTITLSHNPPFPTVHAVEAHSLAPTASLYKSRLASSSTPWTPFTLPPLQPFVMASAPNKTQAGSSDDGSPSLERIPILDVDALPTALAADNFSILEADALPTAFARHTAATQKTNRMASTVGKCRAAIGQLKMQLDTERGALEDLIRRLREAKEEKAKWQARLECAKELQMTLRAQGFVIPNIEEDVTSQAANDRSQGSDVPDGVEDSVMTERGEQKAVENACDEGRLEGDKELPGKMHDKSKDPDDTPANPKKRARKGKS